MESTGIRIDVPYLEGLSSEMGSTLQRLESEAERSRGRGLQPRLAQNSSENCCSTPSDWTARNRAAPKPATAPTPPCLEKLGNDHPVVPLVLEHRVLSKLKSTYIDAFPQLVDRKPDRCTPISTRR